MYSDVSVVQVLFSTGLFQLLLTWCGVEARPNFPVSTFQGDGSRSHASEYPTVLKSDWNVPDQIQIESVELKKIRDAGYHPRRPRRFRRRVGSGLNGNQQNPSKEPGEQNLGEFQNKASTTNNHYRHRNGWGGGYGK